MRDLEAQPNDESFLEPDDWLAGVGDDAAHCRAALRVEVWLGASGATHSFRARVCGGRLRRERDFEDRGSFVEFLTRLTGAQRALR